MMSTTLRLLLAWPRRRLACSLLRADPRVLVCACVCVARRSRLRSAAAQYNAKFANQTLDGPAEFNDGTFSAQKRLEMAPNEANWDSSTWRYVPHSLKGIKPVTNEPWARDEAVYHQSRNSVDTRGAGELSAGELLEYRGGLGEEDDEGWDASLKPPDGAMRAYPA